jgi:sulfate permease, SulP family
MTNVRAGAATPVAGMVHALTLLVIVLAAAPLAMHVPLPALAGVLLFVAWNMGEWREFARLQQFNPPYRTLLLGTFALTVVFDLTVAVEAGLAAACAFFIYRMGSQFSAKPRAELDMPHGVQVFELYGSLFFGAVAHIEAVGEGTLPGTRAVVLDMQRMVLLDTSGLDALEQLHRTLGRRGVRLVFASVNEQPLSLMKRSGFLQAVGAHSVVDTIEQLPSSLGL